MAKFLLRPQRCCPYSLSPVSVKAFDSFVPALLRFSYCSGAATSSGDEANWEKKKGKWFTLPPFSPQIDATAVARAISGLGTAGTGEPMNALKWVRRCCPQLPMSLVQKLFRLRQVRKHLSNIGSSSEDAHVKRLQLRRVSSEDTLVPGDVILLPVSVRNLTAEKNRHSQNENEVDYIRSLELYKDPAIIVINKPPGMPVQGGVGIKYSMDALAATCLKYDYAESPRLAHRLDRDSSGILVFGRTQTSTSILHCIFREKTSGALINNTRRALQRKYLALVIGIPKRSKGLISAPLAKIVLDDGASERITIVNDTKSTSSQHALTEYKVIKSSIHGYTWLELCPLTGRKHQLRVHCAEVLRTPIVGDYKYGWHVHRKWEPMPLPESMTKHEMLPREKLPFGLESDGGSIAEKQPRLHLHCKQMVLPNISVALHELESSSMDPDFSKLERLTFVASLPLHMQQSWHILCS